MPMESTPATLEEFLRAVRAGPGQSLRLPVRVDRGGVFGFSALAIQTVLTWARLHDGHRVLNLASSYATDSSTRTRFAASPHGMAALYLANAVTCGETVLSRGDVLADVAPYVSAMQSLDYRSTVRGTGALLCCFQGAQNEYLSALYSKQRRGTARTPTVRSLSTLSGVVRDMLDASHVGLGQKIGDANLEVLSGLVYQLFNNADIHTVTSVDGDVYSLGLRGIQLRTHRFTGLGEIERYVRDDHRLANYLRKVAVQTSSKASAMAKAPSPRPSTFVELSVFDSGPGLALRWLSAKTGQRQYSEISLAEELESVHKCFSLHSTTQGSGNVGDGLAIAISAMRQLKAFMALRSGRLNLLQDFSSKDHGDFEPQHRFTKKPLLAEIAGASYTICFPVPQ